ncbi:hypothetical protein [Streptomyces sp. ICBB 8177]|nr:hypothetical protein [Streptomyces sp. ICBB 8177]
MPIELERVHSSLELFEAPEGMKAEIVHGEIISSPLRAFHLKTIVQLCM